MLTTPDVAIVLGTYNRRSLLERMMTSARRSVGGLSYRFIVCDGGSTDGTSPWLELQGDVHLLYGDLSGAVRAFNAGFAIAVDQGYQWTVVINDDDEFVGPEAEIRNAVKMLQADPEAGAVAFESDLRGRWAVESWQGMPYANKGVIRLVAGISVARAQGDPTGRRWWTEEHATYASDTEQGMWMHRLGWKILTGVGLRVHDAEPQDALRAKNRNEYTTANAFLQRWGQMDACKYNRADALRFGGIVRP